MTHIYEFDTFYFASSENTYVTAPPSRQSLHYANLHGGVQTDTQGGVQAKSYSNTVQSRYNTPANTNDCWFNVNPLNPHDALKHHLTSTKTDLIFQQQGVSE